MTKRHEASGALVRLVGTVDQCVLLKCGSVTELFPTQFCNERVENSHLFTFFRLKLTTNVILDAGMSVPEMSLHCVFLPESLEAIRTLVRLLVSMN